jgi:hypothetical protein
MTIGKRLQHALVGSLALASFALAGVVAADQSVGGVERDGSGSIKGVIKFDGNQAKRRPVIMSADKYCVSQHDTPVTEERFVFGENDTLQNVLIYVSGGLEGKSSPQPQEVVVIDQVGCMYSPHVSAVMAGQKLQIHNSDNTLHNLNCQPKNNPKFNVGQPVKDMKHDVTFAKPEIGIPLKCDVHPWMNAYVNVIDSPFYAVTGEKGTFEIKGLEPGEYTITTWHEFNVFKPDQESVKVTVKAGEASEVTVTYAPPAKK